jgi:uncharacterized small protein (DUF1192 family)
MAKRKQKDLLSRFADAGEEAFQLLSAAPGADRVLGSALGVMHNMRDQLDALSKRVRGIEELEQRVAKLEKEVAKLSRGSSASRSTRKAATSTSARSSSSSKTASRRKKT